MTRANRVVLVVFAFAVALMAMAANPLVGDQRIGAEVGVSLRPIKPDGETRLYSVPGRREPVFWDAVFPIPIGDKVEIRALPVSGERRINNAVFRLDGVDYESFERLPPYRVVVDTANLAEGWHQVEVFCQQEGRHPMRCSGSVKFLLVRQLEDSESAQKIAALEQVITGLQANHTKQMKAWEAQKSARKKDQEVKVTRWLAAAAEPVAVTPKEDVRVTGNLVSGGGISAGTLPSGKRVRLTGALTAGLGTAVAPVELVELTMPPTAPRPQKITLVPIGEIVIVIRGNGNVHLDYQVADGRSTSTTWKVGGELTLKKVSVPLIVTATFGDRRIVRELTKTNPTTILDFTQGVDEGVDAR